MCKCRRTICMPRSNVNICLQLILYEFGALQRFPHRSDSFWHAQSMLMWFGRREPLHIMALYPGYIYPVCVAVARLRVLENVRPFAAGLGEVLIVSSFPDSLLPRFHKTS